MMKRASLTVDTDTAFHSGEDRQPQVIVRLFCYQHGITVLSATRTEPDGWTFEIETDADHLPPFPPYIIARPHR